MWEYGVKSCAVASKPHGKKTEAIETVMLLPHAVCLGTQRANGPLSS